MKPYAHPHVEVYLDASGQYFYTADDIFPAGYGPQGPASRATLLAFAEGKLESSPSGDAVATETIDVREPGLRRIVCATITPKGHVVMRLTL